MDFEPLSLVLKPFIKDVPCDVDEVIPPPGVNGASDIKTWRGEEHIARMSVIGSAFTRDGEIYTPRDMFDGSAGTFYHSVGAIHRSPQGITVKFKKQVVITRFNVNTRSSYLSRSDLHYIEFMSRIAILTQILYTLKTY